MVLLLSRIGYLWFMKTTPINLKDSTAKQFNELPPSEKSKIEQMVNGILEEVFKRKRVDDLRSVMDTLSEQAQKNGLTIQKLAEIMEWDEQTVENLFGTTASRHAE